MEENNAPRCNFHVADLIATKRVTTLELEELDKKLKQLQVPTLTQEQKAMFLLSCNNAVDFTIATIREYYSARQGAPELFEARSMHQDELIYQMDVIRLAVLPQLTPEGHAILYHSLFDYNASHYHMEHSMKLLLMTLDSIVYDSPPHGLIILFDMKGVGLMHLSRVRFSAVRKFAHYLQEGLPIQLKKIHVINTVYFIDKVMFLFKPFLKAELYKLLHFHVPTDDYTAFHADSIPKQCLPSDFGGDLPSVNDLHNLNARKLHEMQAYFKAEQQQRHDYYTKSD